MIWSLLLDNEFLQFGTEVPFPGTLAENVLGKILFEIGLGEDRCAVGNCGENNFGEFGDFGLNSRRDIGGGKGRSS